MATIQENKAYIEDSSRFPKLQSVELVQPRYQFTNEEYNRIVEYLGQLYTLSQSAVTSVDASLDVVSTKPVENRVVAAAIARLTSTANRIKVSFFKRIEQSGTVRQTSSTLSSEPEEVFFFEDAGTFGFKPTSGEGIVTTQYYNNWQNRDEYTDENNVPFADKLYFCVSNNRLYTFRNGGLVGVDSGIVVDSSLNTSSTNPIQNGAVATAIEGILDDIEDLQGSIESVEQAAQTAANSALSAQSLAQQASDSASDSEGYAETAADYAADAASSLANIMDAISSLDPPTSADDAIIALNAKAAALDAKFTEKTESLILQMARSIGKKLIENTTSSSEQWMFAKTDISVGDTIVVKWECATTGNLFSIERGDASFGYVETIYAVSSSDTTEGLIVLKALTSIASLRFFSYSTGFEVTAWCVKKDSSYNYLLNAEKIEPSISNTGVIDGTTGQVKNDTAWYGSNCRFGVTAGAKVTYIASTLSDNDGYAFYDAQGNYISGGGWNDFAPPEDVAGERSLIVPTNAAYCSISWNRNHVQDAAQTITVDRSFPTLSSVVATHNVEIAQISKTVNGLVAAETPTLNVLNTGVVNGSTGQIRSDTSSYGSNCRFRVLPGAKVTYIASYLDEGDGYAFYDENDTYISGGEWNDFTPPNDVSGERSMIAPTNAAYCAISWNRNHVLEQEVIVDRSVATLSATIDEHDVAIAQMSESMEEFSKIETDVVTLVRKLTGLLLYQGMTTVDDEWLLPRIEIAQGQRILVVWEHTQTGGVVSMATADADYQEIHSFYHTSSLQTLSGEVDVIMPSSSSTLRIFSSLAGLAVKVYRLEDTEKLDSLNNLLEAEAPTFEVLNTGVIVGATGEVKSTTAWYASNARVPVSPGSIVTYIASYLDEGDGYAFYDENDTYISGGWWDDFSAPSYVFGQRSMYAPSGAAWCRVSWNRNLVAVSSQQITVDGRVSTLSLIVSNLSKRIDEISDISRKPHSGKSILSLGDSYTMMNYYGKYLAAATGCQQTPRGYNGQNIRHFAGDTYQSTSDWAVDITQPLTSEILKSYDIITIMGGTNDYGQGYAAGTISDDKDDNTVAGHLKWLINKLYTLNPDARLYVCTQPYRVPHPAFHNSLGAHIRNAGGSTLEECMDIIVAICRYYGIPCLDFYHESGWNEWTNRVTNPENGEPSASNIYPPFNDNPLSIDGLHPRDGDGHGAQQLGYMFGQFINAH